jgi:two-component system chemotaxis response regulator CheY
MRALIVEDDFTSRSLLQRFLSQYGGCDIAVNGKEAVTAFRTAQEAQQPFDLICMDIMMPEMNGLTALREIRALEEAKGTPATNSVKIIMTTSMDDPKDVVESFGSLCDAYLFKPVDTGKLLERMRELHLVLSINA